MSARELKDKTMNDKFLDSPQLCYTKLPFIYIKTRTNSDMVAGSSPHFAYGPLKNLMEKKKNMYWSLFKVRLNKS